MSINRLTAYIIATREDIVMSYGGPSKENGKYVGWITLGEEDHYRSLLNTLAIYDTAEVAENAMKDLVKEIKIAVEKETGGKHPVDHIMGECKESEVVKEIVRGSKNP